VDSTSFQTGLSCLVVLSYYFRVTERGSILPGIHPITVCHFGGRAGWTGYAFALGTLPPSRKSHVIQTMPDIRLASARGHPTCSSASRIDHHRHRAGVPNVRSGFPDSAPCGLVLVVAPGVPAMKRPIESRI
jgi:hypothetical protein